MSRFSEQRLSSKEAATEFDLVVIINPDEPIPPGYRFRVMANTAQVKACEKHAMQFARDMLAMRNSVDCDPELRALIPAKDKELLAFVGKLQFTQVGELALTFSDAGELASKELNGERATDVDWLWLAEHRPWMFKTLQNEWAAAQVMQRDLSVSAEVASAGEASKPPASTGGELPPPSDTGADSLTS